MFADLLSDLYTIFLTIYNFFVYRYETHGQHLTRLKDEAIERLEVLTVEHIENYIKDPEIQKEMELLAENGKKEIIIMKNFKYPENIDIYRVYDKVKRKYGFKYFGPKLGITETLYAEW